MPTPRTEPVIAVESLTKRYGELVAVNEVSFEVGRGEIFALLGPNGAGKTTTVEIIETLRRPTSGTVHVLGMDVARQKRDVVRRIGVLPQAFASFDRLTVRESLIYYARLFGVDADIEGLIALAQLQDKRDAQFRTLSGGLRQRLGIAIALVNEPEIVFLDEPSAGLDPRARRGVWDIVLDLKARGKAVVLTTHYMDEAELLADTVAIITHGRIAALDSPQQLIEGHAREMCLTLKVAEARAESMIRSMHFRADRDDAGDLKVRVRDVDDVQSILNAMKTAGVAMGGMDVRKPDLEEVFLSITGDQLRNESLVNQVCQ